MNILLIIAAVWLVCGALFFIASLICARDVMPKSLVVGFFASQVAWTYFALELAYDGIRWIFK